MIEITEVEHWAQYHKPTQLCMNVQKKAHIELMQGQGHTQNYSAARDSYLIDLLESREKF